MKIVVIGATSGIAQECCQQWAKRGDQLFLVARHTERLNTLAQDIAVRSGQSCGQFVMDVTAESLFSECVAQAKQFLGHIDIVLLAHGVLPDQANCEASFQAFNQQFQINALSVMDLCLLFANEFEQQGHGDIAVISSVAGDRGRQSNYAYGAAKAAVSTFLQGLGNRMHKKGVNVLTIKPGFVDTPMIADMKKGFLVANAKPVAKAIVQAIDKKKAILYVPWFWWGIMKIIKSIPERIFKRLSL